MSTPDSIARILSEYERTSAAMLKAFDSMSPDMVAFVKATAGEVRALEAFGNEQVQASKTLGLFMENMKELAPLNWTESNLKPAMRLMESMRPARELLGQWTVAEEAMVRQSQAFRDIAAQLDKELVGAARVKDMFGEPLRSLVGAAAESERQLADRMREIADISELAHGAYASIKWPDMGHFFPLSTTLQENLRSTSQAFGSSFDRLSMAVAEARFPVVPESIAELPLFEHFSSATLLEQMSLSSFEISLPERKQKTRRSLIAETKQTLEGWLKELDPNLPRLWVGAREARMSDNPDRARHTMVSWRELLRGVLHLLAPDEDVCSWAAAAGQLDEKGRPTRRGRVLYICRGVTSEDFREFVVKDVDALLAFERLLERGTHSTAPSPDGEFLLSMELRFESAVRFLIGVHRTRRETGTSGTPGPT